MGRTLIRGRPFRDQARSSVVIGKGRRGRRPRTKGSAPQSAERLSSYFLETTRVTAAVAGLRRAGNTRLRVGSAAGKPGAGRTKKEMVPSDPIPSLCSPPACTVLSTALQSAVRPAVPLPCGKISLPQDHSFPARRSLVSSTEPAPRNGLFLARNGYPLSEASIPGSKVPACYFKTCQLALPPGPPFCSTATPGSPRWMATSSLLARCGFARRLERLLRLSPLPFGIFAFPPDQSVQQVPPPLSSPSEPARYPLAPRNQIYY